MKNIHGCLLLQTLLQINIIRRTNIGITMPQHIYLFNIKTLDYIQY